VAAKQPAERNSAPAESFLSRELSWLGFARRVLALVESPEIPLIERIKFAGITGMLHDEFFMKRMSGLKRQIAKGSKKLSIDGRTPVEEFNACRRELRRQMKQLAKAIRQQLRPAMTDEGFPINDHADLAAKQRAALRKYFRRSVLPILTPLAVDVEHPFPFISNLGLNLAILLPDGAGGERFVRVKVPGNRPRWVPVPGSGACCPLEQVLEANLDLMFPKAPPKAVHLFRVTRGAEGEPRAGAEAEEDTWREPGSIVRQVSYELKARRFAGIVRLEVEARVPKKLVRWLARQLEIDGDDVYPMSQFLGLRDLANLDPPDRENLRYPEHRPVTHPRLRGIAPHDTSAIFDEIARGDILLHHPYHSFDSSVLRFLESAARDPSVLAIKLTIYRTSSDSPIVTALAEAARRGKQVAVLVEITARFDEAPNIAWGEYLEKEGVHVSYGVERLKTHVKLALVVREEPQGVRRYLHFGTGNYHTETAKLYEDLGILTCDAELCEDAATAFNALTGATPYADYSKLLVAPTIMRPRFVELIRREAGHAHDGRPSGIHAKMNQLQDPEIIRELYRASQAGVPITLNVRGLCCLRPGVPGLSAGIRLFSVVGRFLEHSRVFRFTNGGDPEYYIGSADWMKRNLDRRVETIVPARGERVQRRLARILEVYNEDNCSAWDCGPDGTYVRRRAAEGRERRAAQEMFIHQAREEAAHRIEGAATDTDSRPVDLADPSP
jgi:polyphosphate kinase